MKRFPWIVYAGLSVRALAQAPAQPTETPVPEAQGKLAIPALLGLAGCYLRRRNRKA